jgi:hypothetical protein
VEEDEAAPASAEETTSQPDPDPPANEPPEAVADAPNGEERPNDYGTEGEDWANRDTGFRQQQRQGMRTLGMETRLETTTVAGGAAIGTNAQNTNNIFNMGRNRKGAARTGRFPTATTRANNATYVRFPQYQSALHTATEYGVVYLCGPLGSGRLSTALHILARLRGDDRVIAIDLDDGVDLTTVLDDKVLLPDHGHVIELDATRTVRESTLRTAGGWAIDNQAHIVVIGPPSTKLDRSLTPYAVLHEAPPSEDVLRAHLVHQVNSQDEHLPNLVDLCLTDEKIVEHLAKAPPPAQMAELARKVVEGAQRGQQPAEALALTGTELRERATRVLVRVEATTTSTEIRERHRELAARLAYAVFQDHSMTDVGHAAGVLFAALQNSRKPTKYSRIVPVFDQGVHDLLGEEMHTTGQLGLDPDEMRRAKLVEPSFAHHLLDVAWNDFDHVTRVPLLLWLNELVNDRRQSIVLRAAMTAGFLATNDFSYVYQNLIKPWAVSSVGRRQAAAWALEFAAHNHKLTTRVLRQVWDWALSPNPLMNDTAALAYATDLGTISAGDTLAGLQAVAMDVRLMKRPSVAYAISELYRSGRRALVLDALALWAAVGGQLQVHAARSIVFLSHHNADDDVWPSLLDLAVQDEEVWRQLVVLWRTALTEALTGRRAWDGFLDWLLRADQDDELSDAVERFAIELLTGDSVGPRASFHLARWRRDHPDASLVGRLLEKLKEG